MLHETGGMSDVYGQIMAWAQAGVESAWRRADLRGRRLVVVP